ARLRNIIGLVSVKGRDPSGCLFDCFEKKMFDFLFRVCATGVRLFYSGGLEFHNLIVTAQLLRQENDTNLTPSSPSASHC
ncbi:MAG: hypothetical protein AAF329_05135, partial [Cyanobacteria bacterium P01_A01_bin.17]